MIIECKELNVNGSYIRGLYTLEQAQRKGLVVMLHGFTGHKNEHNFMFKQFAENFSKEGFASLRFDYRGSGDSDLDFSEQSFDSIYEDAKVIIREALVLNKNKPIIILGFSMGGALAAKLTIEFKDVIEKLVLISPAGNMCEILKDIFRNPEDLERGYIDFGGYKIGRCFYDSLVDENLYEGLTEFHKEVFIIQGTADLSVPPQYSKRYSELFDHSQYVLIDDAQHGYNTIDQRNRLNEEIIKFLNK